MFTQYYIGSFAVILFLLLGGLLVKNLFGNKSHSSSSEETMKEKTKDLNTENLEEATLAGGCFWCMEPPFVTLEGVEEVIAGYTGGEVENPTYEEVSTGETGHYEAVKIYFDPEKITFEKILDVYWKHIDPIDPGGQFADRGSQYETAIFFQNEEQKKIAEESKRELEESGKFDHPVVTDILAAQKFYPAERYHQNYSEKNPDHYESYKKLSGRKEFIEKTWKNDEGTPENPSDDYEDFEKPGDEELKQELSPLQYKVTQENGTEKAFQNEYYDNKREGIYVDLISGEPLFSSTDKFQSGSGWPSFTKPLEPSNVVEVKDTSGGMVRTEVRSRHADSHLGHVFDDGPEPTGRRYCVNSAALEFIPVDELEERGYGDYLDLFSREG